MQTKHPVQIISSSIDVFPESKDISITGSTQFTDLSALCQCHKGHKMLVAFLLGEEGRHYVGSQIMGKIIMSDYIG